MNVLDAFLETPEYTTLLDAVGVHPTAAGSAIWAQQVQAALETE